MAFGVWWIWMILAAVLIIAEILTAGFFLLWFGIGAAVAGAAALLGLSAPWQWGIFIIVSGGLFTVSRKFAERITSKQPPGIGADRFLGKKGVVLEEIDNLKNTGRVRIEKEEWRADSEKGEVVPVGEKVEVTSLVGTHLIVKPLKEGE
jgi:membrane protein implicated in regulation of membrane protease activity